MSVTNSANERVSPRATEHQIKSMRRLADLPNRLGFKFLGITRGSTVMELEIVEREDCAFSVSDRMYPWLLGWVKLDTNQQRSD